MLDLSWFEVFCITSNHLQEHGPPFSGSLGHAVPPRAGITSVGSLPRRVLLVFGLHHVAKTGVSEGLREVSVRCHEAVVVEARPQAGRTEAERFALRTTGTAQDALVLGGQIGAKQGLQQLREEYRPIRGCSCFLQFYFDM